MINHVADDLLFVLENHPNPATAIRGVDVLHAVDERLSDRLKLGPEGTTRADAWIARHGDPTASTEAALLFLNQLVRIPISVPVVMSTSQSHSAAKIGKDGTPYYVSGGLPLALCAAGLAHYTREKT